MKSTTIYALSTPWGKSSVAIIRISGKEATKTFDLFQIQTPVRPRLATFTKLYTEDKKLIDEAIVIYFPQPNSFTGENLVELQIHGSKAVINIVLKDLSKIFIPALPGEFSQRAFFNSKMSLTKAEAIADLINSETSMQAEQALSQLSGTTEKLYKLWRSQFLELQSNVEAFIDFPEDITESDIININTKIIDLYNMIKNYLNDNNKGEKLYNGFKVVIIGEPNVGKSTLLNCLAQRDIAIVSEYAGTTRDIIEVYLDISGYPVILIDTAGIRESKDFIEQEGIRRAKAQALEADLKILLFSYESMENDSYKSDIIKFVDDNAICVITKADSMACDSAISINNIDFLPISVHYNKGINALLTTISNKLKDKFFFNEGPIITSERHRYHLNQALHCLEKAQATDAIEILSEELRLAIKELGQIIGDITNEEILDNIFSKFCIGK